LSGYSQVKKSGNIDAPIILTNTISVPAASNTLITYILNQPENKNVSSVNSVIKKTIDGYLNDIRGRYAKENHALNAIKMQNPGR